MRGMAQGSRIPLQTAMSALIVRTLELDVGSVQLVNDENTGA
jgi:hypothetical protein